MNAKISQLNYDFKLLESKNIQLSLQGQFLLATFNLLSTIRKISFASIIKFKKKRQLKNNLKM
ncbi:protein of unknown function [Oenococcus oeni]|nr:hypothetical protein AX764_07430 [Oenococcus oeni]SYV98971.1 hypothetical protein OENI_10524 [Oenococcus oeni]SYV99337.1 hypothetical protein OENI_150032 [Oenococcus oeni]SYW18163.1 hypothetical protein OENI_20233 [Oenococcus oeni]VDC15246.1 protein of unknown function [Oenococcus oeni]